MTTVHCFFSGGRDSALTCYIAKKVADVRGWSFRLVHIDTTIGLEETEEYVKRYAEWLGAELVVLRPDYTFEEYVAKYPYWPHVYPPWARWCYHKLKRIPLERYLKQHYRDGDLLVLGVRRDESAFREREYNAVFTEKYYSDAKVNAKLWLPLLYVDDETLDKLMKKFGIPESPVWYLIGSSGECFCLAGASKKKVERAVRAFPKLCIRLMRIDDIIHANRRNKDESYPIFLKDKRKRLKVWLQEICNNPTLLDYIDVKYEGKSCQGSCIL
jgi:3'-phosphoadenosine 5'-phosphosulfate sulfotransferase (PAPS reductase)/FAD synthetase